MSLLIVEGPEKVGKGRFIKLLQKRYQGWALSNPLWEPGIRYIHHTKGESNHTQVMRDFEYVRKYPNTLFVYDRWWLSELVYRPLDLETPTIRLNAFDLEARYGGLADYYGTRVLLLDDPEVLRARRTADDRPVDPLNEVRLYDELASPAWHRLLSDYNIEWVWDNIVLPTLAPHPTHTPY